MIQWNRRILGISGDDSARPSSHFEILAPDSDEEEE